MSQKTFEAALKSGNEDYRVWIYKRIDGKVVGKVHTATEAAEKITKEGWKLSPAFLSEDENLKNDPNFVAQVDDRVGDRNRLLNYDKIEDKKELVDLVKRYFDVDLSKKKGISIFKKQTLEDLKKGTLELMEKDSELWE